MTYIQWNDLIANYLFSPSRAGEFVFLYLTKDDVVKLGKLEFGQWSDDEIWNDFLNAIKADGGIQETNSISNYLIDRPLQWYSLWNQVDTPPFLTYLVLYIIPLTKTYEGDFNNNNYYGKVNHYFKENGLLTQSTTEFSTHNFQSITHLWNELEEWSILTKNCDLGIFELKKFGNPHWIYVGKPMSQCVLPPRALNKLSELFYEGGMIPNSSYSQNEFKKALLSYGAKILGLKESVIDLIKKSDSNELGQSIIEIVTREYYRWTGETHQDEEDGAMQRIKRNYTVARLFLQFKANTNDGSIEFSFRLYSSNDYPEDLKFAGYDDLYETNGWSKTLNLTFKEPCELKDEYNKWIARFPEKDIRLFVSAGNYQLSTSYWIETESLSRTDQMFLLCRHKYRDKILEWGSTFRADNFKEEDFEGLPQGYSLFKINNPTQTHPYFPLLTLYTAKRIELVGGLKVNFRAFINDFLPDVAIVNSDGNEKVYLQYKNTNDQVFLKKKSPTSNRWELPVEIQLNCDFLVKVEGENFEGNTKPYYIVTSNNSAMDVDGSFLPKRDSFGRLSSSGTKPYCIGSNMVDPVKASQARSSPWGHLFQGVNQESLPPITKATIYNHSGNLLSSYVSLKKTLSTEDFYAAFEFYYAKQFSAKQPNYNFNLTRTKKASINFYDYIGIIDYDYETKKIVANPPQLIFIPCNKGRQVLLIGARDASLLNSIIDTAPKHNLQVEITPQFSSNDRLLLPDTITIKAFETPKDRFGEINLTNFAKDINVPFTKGYYPQLALKLFSANIEDYESEFLEKDEVLQEDFGWARRIFNPETLIYERDESATFDKSFSLVEYKLNEYTYYNRFWKIDKCFKVDKNWGRYIILKHYDKNVILFDDNQNKIAIPVETPLPRLLSESTMLLSGIAPDFANIDGKGYRIYENIPNVFATNLFDKLGQRLIKRKLV